MRLEFPAELVLLAMGFVHPVHEGMIRDLGLDLDPRGNAQADTSGYASSVDRILVAGDMRRGQPVPASCRLKSVPAIFASIAEGQGNIIELLYQYRCRARTAAYPLITVVAGGRRSRKKWVNSGHVNAAGRHPV
jgi:NADPH-dependent glutamate synthase beta subunit-like oxidoreductase